MIDSTLKDLFDIVWITSQPAANSDGEHESLCHHFQIFQKVGGKSLQLVVNFFPHITVIFVNLCLIILRNNQSLIS